MRGRERDEREGTNNERRGDVGEEEGEVREDKQGDMKKVVTSGEKHVASVDNSMN